MSSTSERVTNFSAGPSALPLSVLEQATAGLFNFAGTGIGIAEISHRSKEFMAFLEETERDIREQLEVPSTHKILFAQGGGTGQFAAVVMNMLARHVLLHPNLGVAGSEHTLDYVLTGSWSATAVKEAQRLTENLPGVRVNIAADARTHSKDGKSYEGIPPHDGYKFSANPALIYYCENETVHGVQFSKPTTTSGSGTEDDPWVYPYKEEDVVAATAPLKIPWHPLEKKGQPFLPQFDYVGMYWDLVNRSVGVREDKRIKFHYRASLFQAKILSGKVLEKEVMEIHGSLCHLTFVHQLGRSHLASLSSFITEFRDIPPDKGRWAGRSVKADIAWWVERLTMKNFSRSLVPLGDVIDLRISVDASTDWGIGLKWGVEWDAWKVVDGWKGPWRDIGWLECLAIELLVLHLEARGYRECRIRVLSDNQGIIGAFWKGRSRNVEVNYSIRRFMNILDSLHLFLEVEYVRSEENPADPISRGDLGPQELQIRPSVMLPEELLPYLSHV
ncbi:hypothetical protein NMY22_g19725 [Coprinellus aureogranulatus]|nr:hypothetical protein NMY22_g19725 [Coprinellus aureogranulatus]